LDYGTRSIHYGTTLAKKYDIPKEDIFRMFNLAWSIGASVLRCAITLFGRGAEQYVEKWSAEEGWKDAYEDSIYLRRLEQKKILDRLSNTTIKADDEVTQ
jgi:hypothetical protein